MKPRSMVEVCKHRAIHHSILELYEHEIGRLANELSGSATNFGKHRTATPSEIEADLRSGTVVFYDTPVRCL